MVSVLWVTATSMLDISPVFLSRQSSILTGLGTCWCWRYRRKRRLVSVGGLHDRDRCSRGLCHVSLC
jgi:hypothetical protein